MSRESELIQELRAARKELRQARVDEDEAAAIKAEKRKAREKIEGLIETIELEIETGKRPDPLLAYAEQNGRAAADPPETADERQRGSTASPKGAKQSSTGQRPVRERSDRREVVISPNGPVRQMSVAEHVAQHQERLAAAMAEDPEPTGDIVIDPMAAAKKTYAVYVRDPVTGKAARGLGYIDATSKDKALAMATKKWPAVKPTELLISPPGWEQSPPPAEPERPNPLPADPSKMIDDHLRQTDLEKTDGEPDPTVSQWAASVPVPGVKGAQEVLGSFLATDTEDALAVARARWPGRPDLAVRRAGPPAAAAAADKPPTRKRRGKAVSV